MIDSFSVVGVSWFCICVGSMKGWEFMYKVRENQNIYSVFWGFKFIY